MNKSHETVVLTFELPHKPEKVWRALTEPALLERWLMKTDLQLTQGHVFQFRRDPTPGWNGIVDCEVLESRQPNFLSYSWRSLGVDTVVSWKLEATSSGTHLTLEQSGFKPEQQQAINGARWGWNSMAGEALPKVLAELG